MADPSPEVARVDGVRGDGDLCRHACLREPGAQLSPSWGLDSRLVSGSAGGGKEEEDDITMAYYFLGHEAIDALYNYGRQEAVPMQAPYD